MKKWEVWYRKDDVPGFVFCWVVRQKESPTWSQCSKALSGFHGGEVWRKGKLRYFLVDNPHAWT